MRSPKPTAKKKRKIFKRAPNLQSNKRIGRILTVKPPTTATKNKEKTAAPKRPRQPREKRRIKARRRPWIIIKKKQL